MSEGGHQLSEERGTLSVALSGDFEKEHGERLVEELVAFLETNPTVRRALIDLRGLTSCSVFARSELVRAQRALHERKYRTAFLADRSRFRGLGLWIAHLSEDPNARAVMTEEQARDWLASKAAREARVRDDLIAGTSR